jgi:hypothetical protein
MTRLLYTSRVLYTAFLIFLAIVVFITTPSPTMRSLKNPSTTRHSTSTSSSSSSSSLSTTSGSLNSNTHLNQDISEGGVNVGLLTSDGSSCISESQAHSMGGKVVFFSFADDNYKISLDRITNEAKMTGVFDEVLAYSPKDIPRDYFNAHFEVLNATRGAGYWAWKPYFLKSIMTRLSYGDVIMFADAGCEFTGNPQMFVDIAREYGFLGFRLPIAPKHYVQRWTKGDIFEALGVDMELFGTEKQHVGGIFLIQKTPRNEQFVSDWLRFSEDPQLITDKESIAPNHPDFQENRHDQAIYSLLIYKYGMSLILEDRTFPREYSKVIHAARRRD